MADTQMPAEPGQGQGQINPEAVASAKTPKVENQPDRRRVLIGGVIAAPVILTLKSRALWASPTVPSTGASVTSVSNRP